MDDDAGTRITRGSWRSFATAVVVGAVVALGSVAALAIRYDDGFLAGILGGAATGFVVGIVVPRWSGFIGGLLGFAMGASVVTTVASVLAPTDPSGDLSPVVAWLGGILLFGLLGSLPFMVGWVPGMFGRRVAQLIGAARSGRTATPSRAPIVDVDAPGED